MKAGGGSKAEKVVEKVKPEAKKEENVSFEQFLV